MIPSICQNEIQNYDQTVVRGGTNEQGGHWTWSVQVFCMTLAHLYPKAQNVHQE